MVFFEKLSSVKEIVMEMITYAYDSKSLLLMASSRSSVLRTISLLRAKKEKNTKSRVRLVGVRVTEYQDISFNSISDPHLIL